jgi:hypothetical protein
MKQKPGTWHLVGSVEQHIGLAFFDRSIAAPERSFALKLSLAGQEVVLKVALNFPSIAQTELVSGCQINTTNFSQKAYAFSGLQLIVKGRAVEEESLVRFDEPSIPQMIEILVKNLDEATLTADVSVTLYESSESGSTEKGHPSGGWIPLMKVRLEKLSPQEISEMAFLIWGFTVAPYL